MSKTALTIAIEKVEDSINTFKMFEDINDHAPSVVRALQQTLNQLKALLPTEREQIEQAFRRERKVDKQTIEYFKDNTPSSDYFTKTYEL